jgi:hypothetical protein
MKHHRSMPNARSSPRVGIAVPDRSSVSRSSGRSSGSAVAAARPHAPRDRDRPSRVELSIPVSTSRSCYLFDRFYSIVYVISLRGSSRPRREPSSAPLPTVPIRTSRRSNPMVHDPIGRSPSVRSMETAWPGSWRSRSRTRIRVAVTATAVISLTSGRRTDYD